MREAEKGVPHGAPRAHFGVRQPPGGSALIVLGALLAAQTSPAPTKAASAFGFLDCSAVSPRRRYAGMVGHDVLRSSFGKRERRKGVFWAIRLSPESSRPRRPRRAVPTYAFTIPVPPKGTTADARRVPLIKRRGSSAAAGSTYPPPALR